MRSHPIDILNFNFIESPEIWNRNLDNWKLIECISENGPAGMHFQIMKKNGTFRSEIPLKKGLQLVFCLLVWLQPVISNVERLFIQWIDQPCLMWSTAAHLKLYHSEDTGPLFLNVYKNPHITPRVTWLTYKSIISDSSSALHHPVSQKNQRNALLYNQDILWARLTIRPVNNAIFNVLNLTMWQ